jgi:hypothetical protein
VSTWDAQRILWLLESADLKNTESVSEKPVTMTYWHFCEGLIDPVASSGVLDQLHARPIFSLISDTPDSTKFVSLFSPVAVRALMKTLLLSGRARMNYSGFGANAARPFIDGRHTLSHPYTREIVNPTRTREIVNPTCAPAQVDGRRVQTSSIGKALLRGP